MAIVLIITMVLCAFPRWAFSSPQAGRTQHVSCEVVQWYGLIPAHGSRGRNGKSTIAEDNWYYATVILMYVDTRRICFYTCVLFSYNVSPITFRSGLAGRIKCFESVSLMWSSAVRLQCDCKTYVKGAYVFKHNEFYEKYDIVNQPSLLHYSLDLVKEITGYELLLKIHNESSVT